MTSRDDPHAEPPCVDDVGRTGLTLIEGQRRWVEPWSNIRSIVASRVPDGQSRLAVLRLEVGVHSLRVAETDDVWPWLTAVLHHALDDIEPYDRWALAIMADPAPTTLFPRK